MQVVVLAYLTLSFPLQTRLYSDVSFYLKKSASEWKKSPKTLVYKRIYMGRTAHSPSQVRDQGIKSRQRRTALTNNTPLTFSRLFLTSIRFRSELHCWHTNNCRHSRWWRSWSRCGHLKINKTRLNNSALSVGGRDLNNQIIYNVTNKPKAYD